MAQKLTELVRALGGILTERKKLERAKQKTIGALNRALGRIGYKVVAKTEPGRQRRRRPRKKPVTRKPRRRRAKRG